MKQPRRFPRLLLAVSLCAVTFSLYLPVLDHELVNYDDDFYLADNPYLRLGLSAEGIAWAFTTFRGANWFPLTWLSWLLDYEIYGVDPAGLHLTNLLLHCLSATLLFLVFCRMTGAIWESAFVAAVFALHPLHVESVAWAAERKDVLSGLFWILAMGAYARYADSPSLRRYGLVAFVLAIGLMAKPMLVSLPLVLLLLDVWPLERLRGEGGVWDRARLKRIIFEKLPLLCLAGASAVATILAQQSAGAVQPLGTFPLGVRIQNALLAYLAYIEKAFWPHTLSVYYPHRGEAVSWPEAVVAAIALAGASLGVLRAARRHPYLAVGWLWFLVTLVPVIGLVQVGQQAMADRYTYIPYIGLSIPVAWGASELLTGTGRLRIAGAALGVASLAGLTLASSIQVRVWQDSATLFQHALQVTRENPLAHINLGIALLNRGQLEEAAQHLLAAIRLHPGSAEAYAALGSVRARQQRLDESIDHFRKALRLDPASSQTHKQLGKVLLDQGDSSGAILHFREALALEAKDAEAHNNLAAALIEQGDFAAAIEHLGLAVSLNSEYAEAHNNWGVALLNQGKWTESIEQFRQALSLRPDYAEAHYGWGLAAGGGGDHEQAIAHYRQAIALRPQDPEIHYNLGLAFAGRREFDEAVAQFREAISLRPRYAEAHYSLGLALARLGDFQGAAELFETAVALRPDHAQAHYSLGLVLASRGRFSEAIRRYRQALSLRPDYAEAYNSWGSALASQGELARSIEFFRKAVSLRPDLAEAHNNWSMAAARLGRLNEAFSHVRTALALNPDYPDAHSNLGVLLAGQGKLPEAVRSFREALRLQPDHRQARENLASTLAALRQ